MSRRGVSYSDGSDSSLGSSSTASDDLHNAETVVLCGSSDEGMEMDVDESFFGSAVPLPMTGTEHFLVPGARVPSASLDGATGIYLPFEEDCSDSFFVVSSDLEALADCESVSPDLVAAWNSMSAGFQSWAEVSSPMGVPSDNVSSSDSVFSGENCDVSRTSSSEWDADFSSRLCLTTPFLRRWTTSSAWPVATRCRLTPFPLLVSVVNLRGCVVRRGGRCVGRFLLCVGA